MGIDKIYCIFVHTKIVKDEFHWISMKSRFVRAARETSKFHNYLGLLIVAAVIWSKYCRYGVKHYIIDQSILILIQVEFCTNLWKL